MVDGRTELTHDFIKKEHDIFHKEILLPDNSPEWMGDRNKLWNAVEMVERRKDAQLAREFNISLPRELTEEQNIELAREFVKKNFVARGMVADLCLHHGHIKGEESQPHFHAMVTLREIKPDKQKGFGKKVREWNSRDLINEWRKEWANEANFFLVLNGHDMRIDHRRLEEQGIELEPQTKIGAKAVYSKDLAQARYEEHQQIARENGERILDNPIIALDAITKQQSTFTHRDLARFVNRHTVGDEQFKQVYDKVKGCEQIVFLGRDDRRQDRFTTQEMVDLETKMLKTTIDKSKVESFKVGISSQAHALKTRDLSAEQKAAFYHVTENGDLSCIIGYAGTGKSYMLGAAKEAWEKEGYRVQGMTLSGKAAENLEISSGIRSNTIANRLINWEHDRARLTSKDVVVIDEASMIGSRDMVKILDEAHTAHAKVVLIGDPSQLQAIQAGAAFRSIAEQTGYVEMTSIRRQREKWQQQATRDFAIGNTAEALLAYEEKGHVHCFNKKTEAMDTIIAHWDETRSNQPDKSLLMMAYTRDDVKSLNELAREIRQSNNELGENYELQTARGKRKFSENDRIYFLQNDKELQVKNGTLGTIQHIDEKNNLVIALDRADDGKGEKGTKEARIVKFNLADYNNLEHGYAATVHKAQGSTVDYSFVLASKYFDRQTIYPAMSRHRENVELYYSRDEFSLDRSIDNSASFEKFIKEVDRDNQKDISLDYFDSVKNYSRNYAETRGIEAVQAIDADIKGFGQNYDQKQKGDITIDRMRAAEARLEERSLRESFAAEIRQFERDTGKKISLDVREGDTGIYRGMVEFGGQKYGILEQKNKAGQDMQKEQKVLDKGDIKLVKYENCGFLQRGQESVIKMSKDDNGKEILQACRSLEKSRTKGLELELER
jgi:Ti-type conjugative transfer relaxase TraA